MKVALLTPLVVLLAGLGSRDGLSAKAPQARCKESREAIVFYRNSTYHWQDQLEVTRTRTAHSERWARSCAYLRWTARLWIVRNNDARRRYYSVATNPVAAIRFVFGRYASQALSVSYCETGGTYSVYASNGQYQGLFQMGEYARTRYGHGRSAITQSRAAFHYFADSGYDWSPWECKP